MNRGEIVLVTGGTGFIGSKVVAGLLKTGLRCRVFSNRAPEYPDSSVEYIVGDVRDAVSVTRACEGARYICHMAAALTENPQDPDFLDAVNVGGTRNVLAGAIAHGIERVLHVSSSSVISFSECGLQDESSATARSRNWTPYARSKAMAELEVERTSGRINWTMVYPTRVFGIGPLEECNAATVVIAMHLRGKFPVLPGGGHAWANWAFVDDVADGMVRALLSGRNGERYILGGENATLAQILALARRIGSVRRFALPVPHRICRAAVFLEELRAKLVHYRPQLTRGWYDAIFESATISCAKAVRDLGYHITPIEHALENVVYSLQINDLAGVVDL